MESVTLIDYKDSWIGKNQGKFTYNNIHFNNFCSDEHKCPLVYINGVGDEYSENMDYDVLKWNIGMGHEIVDFWPGEYIIARKDNNELVLYSGTHYLNDDFYTIRDEIVLPCTKEEFRYSDASVGIAEVLFVRNNTLYLTDVTGTTQGYTEPKMLYFKSGENIVKVTDLFYGYNYKSFFRTEEGKFYEWHGLDEESVSGKTLMVPKYEIPNIVEFISPMSRQFSYSIVTVSGVTNALYVYNSGMGENWRQEAKEIQLPYEYNIYDIKETFYKNTEDLVVKFNDGSYYNVCLKDVKKSGSSMFYMKELIVLNALEAAGSVEFFFGSLHEYGATGIMYVVMDDQHIYSIEHYE